MLGNVAEPKCLKRHNAFKICYIHKCFNVSVDVHAYCNFDNIFANGKLETRINYDFNYLKFPFGWQVTVAVFYNIISTVRESRTSFLIFDREDGNCTQEVKQI